MLSGTQFNELTKNLFLVKLTNQTENHHGFQYQTGLNIDTGSIRNRPCSQGLYFTELDKIPLWLDYKHHKVVIKDQDETYVDYVVDPMIWYRTVTIPDTAQVYIEKDKFKTDQFILSERKRIEELSDPQLLLKILDKDYRRYKYVKQTPELSLEVVKINGLARKYVIESNPEIDAAAVQQNGLAIEYVKNPTPELWLMAIRKTPKVIQNLESKAVRKQALSENGMLLQYLENPDKDECLAAVRNQGMALAFVKNKTPLLCLEAVKHNGVALVYVDKQTPEIQEAAIHQNPEAKYYVKN